MNCDPLDDHNHGTDISRVIGAHGNRLIGIKILSEAGIGSVADAINGIEAAVQMKSQGINVRVLNASWGTDVSSAALEQAIAKAAANDILFVTLAGGSPTHGARNRVVLTAVIVVSADGVADFEEDLAAMAGAPVRTVRQRWHARTRVRHCLIAGSRDRHLVSEYQPRRLAFAHDGVGHAI